MKGSIKEVDTLHYAHVKRITIKVRGGLVTLEIPEKILDEAGWTPRVDDSLEVEVSSKRPADLDKWDIVMVGDVYLKKEENKRVYASFGGLKAVFEGEKFYSGYNVDDRVYVSLRKGGET